jgi:hypothetical protein
MVDKPVVGDSRIHKRFFDAHVPFLREFPEIQKLADKMWSATLQRYNQPLISEPTGEDLEKHVSLRLAQIIVFYLAKTSFDCLYDIFILAGNYRGFAAKMMLRPMYEHLVTASFIALKPEEARLFDDNASIQKWKIWTRTVEVIPQVKDSVSPEQISTLDKRQQEARSQLKSEICSKCKQPNTQAAWTRVSLDTMAAQVDAATGTSLVKLYTPCYLIPTALAHATPFGLEMRLTKTEDDHTTYNELPEDSAHDSLLRGHGMALRLLKHVDSYFCLGLGAEVEARWRAFPQIWNGALVDPPPMEQDSSDAV